MSDDSDDSKQRRSDLWLLAREVFVACMGIFVFVYLAAVPGKVSFEFSKWNADTVAVLANAATVAGVMTIPAAIVFGGTDLLAWITRVIARTLRDQRRRALARRLATPISDQRVGPLGGRSVRRQSETLGCILTTALATIAAILVAWLAFWVVSSGVQTVGRWLSHHQSASASHSIARTTVTPIDTGSRTLPSFCSTEGGDIVCSANSNAKSPEDIGHAACGRRGMGWPIFRENREKHGFTFDPLHVPPGTRFSVHC